MSTLQTINNLLQHEADQLITELKSSVYFKEVSAMNFVKEEKSNLILTSLFVTFIKMALIDRDFDDSEEAHIIKRLQRFINKDTLTLFKASGKIKTLMNKRRSDTKLIYAFGVYLAKVADHKTKDRIFNSFIQIAQADNEISEEEKYLIKNYSLIFGMSEKDAFEQILKASLLAQTSDPLDARESQAELENDPSNEAQAPVIRFDF